MKRPSAYSWTLFAILFCGAKGLAGQVIPAANFLEGVASHAISGNALNDQSAPIYQALATAPFSEVAKALPGIFRYTHKDNEAVVRKFAELLITAVAIRLDGGELLSSASEDIRLLIADVDPGIQTVAIVIMGDILASPKTDRQAYLLALVDAMQNPLTPQDVLVQMPAPLLAIGTNDRNATKAVLDFLHRNDLTESTRISLLDSLGERRNIPKEIRRALIQMLDDPSLQVRAIAVINFSNSNLGYDPLAKSRVQQMLKDPKENNRLRALAKEALAGHSHLNPNINMTPYEPSERNPVVRGVKR